MADNLFVCLFDEVGSTDQPFSKPFEQLDQVQIVSTESTPEGLLERLARGDIDVVAANLDGATTLETVRRVAQRFPECGVIGVSAKTDATFIIGAMRAGCAQYVCWPIDPQDLKNALQRIRPNRSKAGQSTKRICVVGSSGGAGATTIACNLAMELGHLTGQRTAIVDMNLEYGDVCCSFDCKPKYSLSDICAEGDEVDEETLKATLHDLPCNVSILARPERQEDARNVSADGVDRMFRLLGEMFHHIVVDMPRAYSGLGSVAVARADYILVVTQLGVPFIRNATRIHETLIQMGANEKNIQIVLNRCNAEFERITVKDVEQHFDQPVFAVIPNDYKYVSASLDLGHPIGADSPSSPARTAILEMTKKIAPEHALAKEGQSAGSRIWGKLMGRRQKS